MAVTLISFAFRIFNTAASVMRLSRKSPTTPGIVLVAGLLCTTWVLAQPLAAIRNPFYSSPQWKLWHHDPQPVQTSQKMLAPTRPNERFFPTDSPDIEKEDRFLNFREGDWPARKYAGIWDDVYASLDGKHSYLPAQWTDGHGNIALLRGQSMDFVYSPADRGLRKFGVTFTSQSTIGVGHELIDSQDEIMALEREFCFANILRAGPAHISYIDNQLDRIQDSYDAIVPCFFNSVGSSSSEENALAKMMIAGGYLPTATKYRLKENGLYIPVLLYIWKAGLPYKVPYNNELRHRVAYASSGRPDDTRLPVQVEINHTYHRYDETQHLKNMTSLAKSMDSAPPIALLQNLNIEGGNVKSVNKTAIRVHQRLGKSIRMHISARDSFDLDDRPLSFDWQLLYGNTKATIDPQANGEEAIITIPYDAKLPKGRTVIMLTVNNGVYDSNPAMINIYRPNGKPDLRPSLSGLSDQVVLSGEMLRFDIASEDPEGFPTTLYQWSDQVGELTGSTFSWQTPLLKKATTEPVSIITTDGTSSYNSKQIEITVTPTIAEMAADAVSGPAPLSVNFSSAGSKDIGDNRLAYAWDFDDGRSSTDRNPSHAFSEPGFYEVTLTVEGPYGQHTTSQVIHAEHDWNKVIDNGWRRDGVDESVWLVEGAAGIRTDRNRNFKLSMTIRPERDPRDQPVSLTSVNSFVPPLFVQATLRRAFSRRGSGVEVLGNLIGKLDAAEAPDAAIGHLEDDGTPVYQPISRELKAPRQPSKLSLYVTRDPNHAGKIRFSGWLETPLATQFFQFDDQEVLTDKINILTRTGSGKFVVTDFGVWVPD